MNNTQQTNQQQEQTIVSFTKGNPIGSNGVSPNGHVGGTNFHKELEPMPSLQTHSEWMAPVENHVELEPEVEEAGVEAVPFAPHISKEEKNIGVQLAKEAAKIEKAPGIQLKVSMTKAQAQQLTQGSLLTKNTTNPILWLAMLVYRQFQMAERKA